MNRCLVLLLCCTLCTPVAVLSAVADQKEEQQVRATLDALFQAYANRDTAAAARIYHENLTYGHTGGTLVWTKTDAVTDVQKRLWSIKVISTDVKVTGPVAVVRSILDIRNGATKEMDNVQPGVRVLYVFIKTPRDWQVIARQALRHDGATLSDP